VTQKTCFATDASLGKLCKWLRILGFDALYERDVSSWRRTAWAREGRCLLTRITGLKEISPGARTLFIRSNDPFEQLKQVVGAVGISADDLRPLSRCIRCNLPLADVDKASALNRVPDYIWETVDSFCRCPACGRFYWRGTHSRRIRERIRELFGDRDAGSRQDSRQAEDD
jgi:uncharacterized protein with PIN domain